MAQEMDRKAQLHSSFAITLLDILRMERTSYKSLTFFHFTPFLFHEFTKDLQTSFHLSR